MLLTPCASEDTLGMLSSSVWGRQRILSPEIGVNLTTGENDPVSFVNKLHPHVLEIPWLWFALEDHVPKEPTSCHHVSLNRAAPCNKTNRKGRTARMHSKHLKHAAIDVFGILMHFTPSPKNPSVLLSRSWPVPPMRPLPPPVVSPPVPRTEPGEEQKIQGQRTCRCSSMFAICYLWVWMVRLSYDGPFRQLGHDGTMQHTAWKV